MQVQLPIRRGLRAAFLCGVFMTGLFCVSCSKKTDDGADPQVTTKGSIEVTAQLVEIRGEFYPNNLYDYAYILKYKVLQTHRGKVHADTILVGQYNPLKPRSSVADERVKDIGGNLKKFVAGDVHRMALEVPIDDYYMGPIGNKYQGEDKGPIYWAVWTNRVVR
jgi:hypothetical protein